MADDLREPFLPTDLEGKTADAKDASKSIDRGSDSDRLDSHEVISVRLAAPKTVTGNASSSNAPARDVIISGEVIFFSQTNVNERVFIKNFHTNKYMYAFENWQNM